MWDDHEVVNNWSPSLDLQRDQRYRIKDLKMLAATAARAFREYSPMPLEGFDEAGALYRRVSYGPQLDLFVLDMQTYRSRTRTTCRPRRVTIPRSWGGPRSTG